MEDLTNIWNAGDELNEDELIDYVNGKSSSAKAHDMEEKMADSAFINDAVEGLQQFSSTGEMYNYVQQLNEQLHKQLAEKKLRRNKRLAHLSWEVITVLAIIFFCIIGFVILKMMNK